MDEFIQTAQRNENTTTTVLTSPLTPSAVLNTVMLTSFVILAFEFGFLALTVFRFLFCLKLEA